MSFRNEIGLSLTVSDPLWFSVRAYYPRLAMEIVDWTHVTAADSGYKEAHFKITLKQTDVDDWIVNGLGRHVEAYDADLEKVWEGFVDQVELSVDGLQVTRGPLMKVTNKLTLAYVPLIDTTVTPPVHGTSTKSATIQDVTSQGKYGVQEDYLSGGKLADSKTITSGAGTTEVNDVMNTYLADTKEPDIAYRLSTDGTVEPVLVLHCLGYFSFLDRYQYISTTTGTVGASTKLLAVLTASPNAIFSTVTWQVAANSDPLTAAENRKARAVVDEIISMGDPTFQRYTFGFYNDRVPVYQPIPTVVEYEHRIGDKGKRIAAVNGDVIPPWKVLPGKWMQYMDFLTETPAGITTLRQDPRVQFIESVTFNAPDTVAVEGSKTGTLKQLLARKGLSNA